MTTGLNDLTSLELIEKVSRGIAAAAMKAEDEFIRTHVFGVDEATWAEWAENGRRQMALDRKWPRRWVLRFRYRREFIRARIEGAIDILRHGGEYIP